MGRNHGDKAGGLSVGSVAIASGKRLLLPGDTIIPNNLTMPCHGKRVMHRVWASFHARLAFTLAAFNVLVQGHDFQPYASGFVPVSMAEFSQSV